MLPTDMEEEGNPVFLLGVRETEAEPFLSARTADPGARWTPSCACAGPLDPAQREGQCSNYANNATPTERPDLRDALAESAFAHCHFVRLSTGNREKTDGGLQALGKYLEDSVPESERERASEVLLRILNGILFELTQQLRSQTQLFRCKSLRNPALVMAPSGVCRSDAQYYLAPAAFMLEDFDQMQASVFLVSPRKARWCITGLLLPRWHLACSTCAIGACGSGWPLKPRPPKTPMPPWPCR